MEYAKSFVLYSILHELSKTLGAEVTDGWLEQLTPICVDGDMFAVHISDDAFARTLRRVMPQTLTRCFGRDLTHHSIWRCGEMRSWRTTSQSKLRHARST